MKKMNNKSHVEGYLYEHKLELRTSGPNSKNPGMQYIAGDVKIATDEAMTNIITVSFTYVAPTTSKGPNATYVVLNDIINGALKSVMADGADKAAKLTIDSAIGLNEFWSDRSGKEEFVSTKRNDGGFVHTTAVLNEDEKLRNTFDVDMIITGTRSVPADDEKNLPEKLIIKGAIFDYRKNLLPVEFSVLNPAAIGYFEDLGASSSNPVFTHIRGRQISEAIERTVEDTSAWGEVNVRKYVNTRKDFVVTWAASETYEWDTEGTITSAELKTAMAERENTLAEIRARYDASKAARGQAPAPAANSGFNF